MSCLYTRVVVPQSAWGHYDDPAGVGGCDGWRRSSGALW